MNEAPSSERSCKGGLRIRWRGSHYPHSPSRYTSERAEHELNTLANADVGSLIKVVMMTRYPSRLEEKPSDGFNAC